MTQPTPDPDSTPLTGSASPVDRSRGALPVAIGLGILADHLLRDGPWGLGLAAWIAAFALAVLHLLRSTAEPVRAEGRVWLATAVLCASALAWRDAALLHVFDVLGMLVALTLLATTLRASPFASVSTARVRDLIRAAVGTALSVSAGALPRFLRGGERPATGRWSQSWGWRLLRAALIAAPVLLVFTALLSSADPVFGAYLRRPAWSLDQLLSHVLISGFFAWVVAGWLYRSLDAPAVRAGVVDDRLPVSLAVTDLAIMLGGLSVLFTAFVAVQVGWLFGGEALVVRTTGLTYAAYARRGFAELTAVSALLLPVLLVTGALVPADDPRARRLHRRLSTLLVALLAVIMVSAGARMQLYVHYYGISVDRLYATAVMAWLALVFLWLAVTVLRDRPRHFVVGAVGSGYAVLLALNVLGPDAWVARHHLARVAAARSPQRSDLAYVSSLGGDAMPAVVAALLAPPATPAPEGDASRCGAAAVVLERWAGAAPQRFARRWTQWNRGRSLGAAAVRAHERELQALACPGGLPGPMRP